MHDTRTWAPGALSETRTEEIVLPGIAGLRIVADAGSVARAEVAVDETTVRLRVPAAAGPRSLAFTAEASDAIAIWRPGSGENRGRLAPSWTGPSAVGPFDGAGLGVLVGRGDRSLLGWAVHAGPSALRVRVGMVEETAELLVVVDLDGTPGDEAHALDLVLETGDASFASTVPMLASAIGLTRPEADARNREPVYCSWYTFHQALDPVELALEAERAAELGFGTVIVDDGWQNDDTLRGYGSCGDWELEPAKVGGGRALVDRLAASGLSTLWWIGTPWVGYRSRAYQEGEYALADDDPGMEAAVLDPRSPSTRRLLVDRLVALADDSGAAGFKLDFLERFGVSARGPVPADADTADTARGGLRLLEELRAALQAGAEPMIEFREPYLSPEAVRLASMLRVGDCPLSPALNRIGIVDLRLASHGIAIHSDPVMWSDDDTPERVAQHLVHALFGVPQISVHLGRLRDDHRAVLAHWLGFWREHADALLGDGLEVDGVDRGYTAVHARRGDRIVTARYAADPLAVPGGDWTEWHIANGAEAGAVLRGGRADESVTVLDAAGGIVADAASADLRLADIPVPAGGRIVVRRVAG